MGEFVQMMQHEGGRGIKERERHFVYSFIFLPITAPDNVVEVWWSKRHESRRGNKRWTAFVSFRLQDGNKRFSTFDSRPQLMRLSFIIFETHTVYEII